MDKITDYNLTEAASQILDDIIDEYRDNLLKEAYLNSLYERKDNKEISSNDIYYAKEIIEQNAFKTRRSNDKRTRMYRIMILSGVLYAILGGVLYFVQNYSFDIHKDMGLIIAVVGVAISFMSLFFYKVFSPNHKTEMMTKSNRYTIDHPSSYSFMLIGDSFDVVKLWAQIERIGRKLMEMDNQDYDNNKGITPLIVYLRTIFTDPEDRIKLKNTLFARNEIAHGKSKYTTDEITEIINTEKYFIEKLEELLENKN